MAAKPCLSSYFTFKDFKCCIVFSCGSSLISFTQLRSSWTPESSYTTGPLLLPFNSSPFLHSI